MHHVPPPPYPSAFFEYINRWEGFEQLYLRKRFPRNHLFQVCISLRGEERKQWLFAFPIFPSHIVRWYKNGQCSLYTALSATFHCAQRETQQWFPRIFKLKCSGFSLNFLFVSLSWKLEPAQRLFVHGNDYDDRLKRIKLHVSLVTMEMEFTLNPEN